MEVIKKISDDTASILVLLIEDDQRLASLTAHYLEKHGLTVQQAHDGTTGLSEAMKLRYDVILLDLMLPGLDGLEVCRKIRQHADVPIIMLTARDEEADCVMGLELGADDYVTKPFSSRVLLARIKACVRRGRGKAGPSHRPLQIGQLAIDPGSMSATMRGNKLDLTAYEFELLRILAEHAGRVLSREQLLDLAKGNTEESFDRSIDVHISRLRQKLGHDPKYRHLIKTVRGSGYMFSGGEDT
jgi:two-component system, OmpR family, response regulator